MSGTAPLSPYRRNGTTLLTSGLTGRLDGALAGPDLRTQTRQIFTLLDEILTENGLTRLDVIATNLYLTSIDNLPEANALYAEYFTPPYPTRTTIECGLGPGVLVELAATAALPAVDALPT